MLSRSSEYALRALIYLTDHQDELPISGQQIAEDLAIPRKYLSKILSDLTRTGLLKATRGKCGGFDFAKPPNKATLLEVVSPFERFDLRRCPFGNAQCGDDDPCLAHEGWKKVVQAEQLFLQKTALSKISQPKRVAGAKKGRRTKRK